MTRVLGPFRHRTVLRCRLSLWQTSKQMVNHWRQGRHQRFTGDHFCYFYLTSNRGTAVTRRQPGEPVAPTTRAVTTEPKGKELNEGQAARRTALPQRLQWRLWPATPPSELNDLS